MKYLKKPIRESLIFDFHEFLSIKENVNSIPTNIIIGDSLTPLLSKKSKLVDKIDLPSEPKGGANSLWKGGIGCNKLLEWVRLFPVTPGVKNVVIEIGTNGRFNPKDKVESLIDEIKIKFPNAKIYAVQGSWGWGGNKGVTIDLVKRYYDKFRNKGVVVIEPPIGDVSGLNPPDPHHNHEVYTIIANEIDRLISGSPLDKTQVNLSDDSKGDSESTKNILDAGSLGNSKSYIEKDNSGVTIYKDRPDPYDYKVIGGVWFSKGPKLPEWTSIDDKVRANEILDARHPDARTDKEKKDYYDKHGKDSQKLELSDKEEIVTVDFSGNAAPLGVCAHIAKFDSGSKAENCLKNIELNLENGTDMIEVDIQVTKDGVPVLFHDSTLDGKTNGSGKISNLYWSAVKNISYDADETQRIASLQEVIDLFKKYPNSKTKLQLDKCDEEELSIINSRINLSGLESRIIAKGSKFQAPSIVSKMGIKWMPIIPSKYVGVMNNKKTVEEIVGMSQGFDLIELQFGLNDSYVLNGYLAQELKKKGCGLLGVAVTGTKTTNPNYTKTGWGDNEEAWKKYAREIGVSYIMTNLPRKCKNSFK
jgi:hypothetical protein